jgi:membrane associated rhomboid family serine protease
MRSGPTRVALLRASLGLLALVVLIALTGLALDGNWPKVLRVAGAFAGYAAVLMASARLSGHRREDGGSPVWPFLMAGATAGAISGLVRPEFDALRLAVHTLAAPLLGAVHALAVERLHRALSSPSAR